MIKINDQIGQIITFRFYIGDTLTDAATQVSDTIIEYDVTQCKFTLQKYRGYCPQFGISRKVAVKKYFNVLVDNEGKFVNEKDQLLFMLKYQ